MTVISNSTFASGQAPWRPVNNASVVTVGVVTDGTARAGASFLRASTTQPGGSVAIDTAQSNLIPINAYVLAWVRAPQGPVQGTLTIWELGQSPAQNLAHPDRPFSVYGDEWIMIESALDCVPSGASSSVSFRVEFYINTVGQPLDIDTVMFWGL